MLARGNSDTKGQEGDLGGASGSDAAPLRNREREESQLIGPSGICGSEREKRNGRNERVIWKEIAPKWTCTRFERVNEKGLI